MRVWIKTAVCIGLAVAGTGAASADQGTAVAQAAGGGTAAGCVSVVDTRPDEEPAELYKMAKGCADANDFHRGYALALLARLRMRYDAERFKDKHAF